MSGSKGSKQSSRRSSAIAKPSSGGQELLAWGGLGASMTAALFVRVWPSPTWAAAALLVAAILTGWSQFLQWQTPGKSQLPRWSVGALLLALMLTSLGQPTAPAPQGAGPQDEPADPGLAMVNDGPPQIAAPEVPEEASRAARRETSEGPRRSILESGTKGTPLQHWIPAAEIAEKTLPQSLRTLLLATEAQVWLEPGKNPADPERAIVGGVQLAELRECDQSARKQSIGSLLLQLGEERIEQLELPLLDDDLARQLEPLKNLQVLGVAGDYQLSEEGWRGILQGGSRTRRLSVLRLRGQNTSPTPWASQACAALAELAALRELELHHLPIDLGALATVAKQCAQLRDVTLRDCDFSPSSAPFPVFAEVVSLDLSGSRLSSSQLSPLAQANKLQVLLMERMQVGPDWACGKFAQFESLRRLSLRGTPCTLADALELVRLRRLRVLDLIDSGLTPGDLEAVQRTAAPELRLATP